MANSFEDADLTLEEASHLYREYASLLEVTLSLPSKPHLSDLVRTLGELNEVRYALRDEEHAIRVGNGFPSEEHIIIAYTQLYADWDIPRIQQYFNLVPPSHNYEKSKALQRLRKTLELLS